MRQYHCCHCSHTWDTKSLLSHVLMSFGRYQIWFLVSSSIFFFSSGLSSRYSSTCKIKTISNIHCHNNSWSTVNFVQWDFCFSGTGTRLGLLNYPEVYTCTCTFSEIYKFLYVAGTRDSVLTKEVYLLQRSFFNSNTKTSFSNKMSHRHIFIWFLSFDLCQLYIYKRGKKSSCMLDNRNLQGV